jgi:lactoylglutathione lyase
MFGLEVTGTFRRARERGRGHLRHRQRPFKVEVDLMQPLDPDKKPAVHTTPLNHIGLWIDDLPVAVEWLGAQGVRFAPGGIRKGAAGFDITFLHPKGNDEFPIGGEGVLIELVQAPPEVVDLPPEAGRCRHEGRHQSACPPSHSRNGKRVACVGAGPASLTVARDLAAAGLRGHGV